MVQSQDPEEMRLGLSYIEMLLTRVPRVSFFFYPCILFHYKRKTTERIVQNGSQFFQGNEVVQVTPRCLEVLGAVNPAPDPELYTFANSLVDKFYEETPGLESF